jgi:PmbA protein
MNFNGLPDKTLYGIAAGKLDLYDPEIEQIPADRKIQILGELEAIGLKQNPLITNSGGAFWNDSYGQTLLINTRGFTGVQDFSSCSLSLQLVAEKDGVKQTDYWWSGQRSFSKLDAIESIAKTAAERTMRKVGARKPNTQTVPVVFDPQTGGDFLKIISAVIMGNAVYQKDSFLIDKIGQPIAVPELKIIDDAIIPGGLGSRYFDDEGLPGRRNLVIEDGVLKTYLCDCYSARQLKTIPTGSARRGASSEPSPATANFFMNPGKYSPEEIIGSVKNGLYLTEVNWVGINYVTGDYSRGAEGIWIEDGKLTYPVQECTVAGNMLTMLNSIKMIANDLDFRGTVNSPTFLIEPLTISGQ